MNKKKNSFEMAKKLRQIAKNVFNLIIIGAQLR